MPLPRPIGLDLSEAPECFVTLLMGGTAYLPGLRALSASLRDTNASRPLMVLTTDVPSLELLELASCMRFSVQWVPLISNPFGPTSLVWLGVLTKLHLFRLNKTRVVYLDLDTIVLRNIDELFEDRSAFNAVPDSAWDDQFNSGVMTLTPSIDTFTDMMVKKDTAKIPQKFWDGGDQGFLNWYFADSWHPNTSLPLKYNTLKYQELDGQDEEAKMNEPWECVACRQPEDPPFDLGEISVLHLCGTSKPWTPPALLSSFQRKGFAQSYGAWRHVYESYEEQCGNLRKPEGGSP